MSEWGTTDGESLLPAVGEIVGDKYQLTQQVGAGGMGAVYEAVHIEIGSKSAVKFLHPRYSESLEAVERFQREARAAAAIGHDAIIGVHDIGRTLLGLPYLVMELLPGESLGDCLYRTGTLATNVSAYVVCQVLSGLAAAHDVGIVHRDLKPDNIFLVETGAMVPGVKILDFGISKILGSGSTAPELSGLTKTGAVLGTPEYMSPEQARGEDDIDHRADLFAIGVILYECLTGVVPFTGNNYNAVMVRIIQDDPVPPSVLVPDLDRTLESVILRSLSKEPKDRYQNAADMFSELIGFVDERAVGRISMPSGVLPPTMEMAIPANTLGDDDLTTVQLAPPSETELSWESGERTAKEIKSRSWVRLLLLSTVAVVVLGGGVGVLFGLATGEGGRDGRSESLDTAALISSEPVVRDARVEAPVTPPPPPPPPIESKLVQIDLTGLPAGARVLFDDRPVEKLPLRVDRADATRTLRVELDGHEPFEMNIDISEDRLVEVTLEPATVEEQRPGVKQPGRVKIRRPPRIRGKQPQNTYSGPEYIDD